jgi:hypothetical protein
LWLTWLARRRPLSGNAGIRSLDDPLISGERVKLNILDSMMAVASPMRDPASASLAALKTMIEATIKVHAGQ